MRFHFEPSAIEVGPGALGFSRFRRDYKAPLIVLMCAVGVIVLIVCANVDSHPVIPIYHDRQITKLGPDRER